MLKIRFIVLMVVLVVAGAQAFAAKPSWDIGDLSFSDAETDMIKSDGLGPYAASIYRDRQIGLRKDPDRRVRGVYFDFSNCVSDTCVPPFVADTRDIGNILILGARDMLPGESKAANVHFYIKGPKKKHPGWIVFCRNSDANPPVMTAFDTDGDDETDRWVIEASADTVGELTTDYGATSLGYYALPFTLVFDLED